MQELMEHRQMTMQRRTNALLIHGFTGAPSDVEPITNMLRAHDWNCHAPMLPGHEDGFANIGSVRWTDWLATVEEEARQCAERYGSFSVVGFSMGGLLAAYVANRYPVERVVLLNASVIYVSPMRLFSFLWEKLRERDMTQLRRVSRIPQTALLQFMKMAAKLRHEFRHIRQPTLICQSGRDQIVHPRSADYLKRVIPGETQVITFPRSKHVICWDVETEQVLSCVKRFLIGPT
jgi:esterase/lipase